MNLIKFVKIFNHLIPLKKRLVQKKLYEPVLAQKKISLENTPLFDTVFFEVRTRCNGNCSFCAASVKNEIRPDISMPLELYEKVIHDLKAIDFKGRIAYHNNSEPLIFKDLIQFIEIARRNIPAAKIQILTNGNTLTPGLADRLIKAGVHNLSISYYNDDLKAELPEKLIKIAAEIIPNQFNKNEVSIEGFGQYDIKNSQAKFQYKISRRLQNETLTSRAGTSPNKKSTQNTAIKGFCQYPWTQFIVTADGNVPMCCSDLHYKQIVGNVRQQSVMEIWNGKKINHIRKHLLKANRKAISTCTLCDFIGVKYPKKKNIFIRLLYKMIA